MNKNIWNTDYREEQMKSVDELLNFCGYKPILAKKSANEEIAIKALREISVSLTFLLDQLYMCIEDDTFNKLIFCRDLADETIRKIEGKDDL